MFLCLLASLLGSFYSLPQSTIDTRFKEVQAAVDERWSEVIGDSIFPLYQFQKSEDDIHDEFNKFSSFRYHLHFDASSVPYRSNSFFQLSQELIGKNRFRQPNCISFEHSLTDTSYNSSCIQVGKRRFLALEGPLEEHVPYFFRLLLNWNVASLVCLTNAVDKRTPKCHPYWIDRTEGGQIKIPVEGQHECPIDSWETKKIPFFAWHDWEDHSGIDPKQLIEAANFVRKGVKENDLIAVHCSAGVGRTGTFISAILLLDAIDEEFARGKTVNEIELSISRLFLYLNFHRPSMVAKAAQYETLYRMVDFYLEMRGL